MNLSIKLSLIIVKVEHSMQHLYKFQDLDVDPGSWQYCAGHII